MEKSVMTGNIEIVARQRNLLLVLVILCAFSCLLLSLKLVTTEEKIIQTPGLNQEVWTSSKGVSSSYLAEVSSTYLPFLLDLDSGSIDWKRDRLMEHVSQSDERYMRNLVEYFARTKEKYQKFALSTHFAVKKFDINTKDLVVKAEGQLTSRFGERGFKSLPITYRLSYEWLSGKLLLKEFVKLGKEGEVESEKSENQ